MSRWPQPWPGPASCGSGPRDRDALVSTPRGTLPFDATEDVEPGAVARLVAALDAPDPDFAIVTP